MFGGLKGMLLGALVVVVLVSGAYLRGRIDGNAICESKYTQAALESALEAMEEQRRQTEIGLEAAAGSAQIKEIIKWRTREIEVPVREGCELGPDGIRLRQSIVNDATDRLSGNNPAPDAN